MKLLLRTLLVIVLFGAFGLTAVSAQDESGKLTIWLLTDDPEIWDSIIASFNEAYPNIEAEWEGRSIDGHKEALRQVINTSAVPDLFFMYSANGIGLGGFYIAADGVMSLDEYYAQYGWSERFTEAALAASTVNDQLYAVPFRNRTMGLFYNRSVFEQAGIESEPTTYEELVAANEALVEAGFTPLSMGGKFSWMTMRLLDSLLEWACGIETHAALKNMEASWTEEACVTEAFTELRRWVDEGWLPNQFLGVDPDEARLPVYFGQAGMVYDGDWLAPRMPDEGVNPDDIGFFHFPTGTGRISYFNEELFIPDTAANPDAAALFLDYISSPEVQEAFAGSFGSLPPTVNSPIPDDASDLVLELIDLVNQAPGLYLPGDQALPLSVVNEYWRAQDEVIAGDLAPEAAGALVQAAIDTYLAQN